MSLYLDTNVLIALLLPDALAGRSENLLANNQSDLAVSDFAAAEFASVISRKVRTAALSRREGQDVLGRFDRRLAADMTLIEMAAVDLSLAASYLRRLDLALMLPDAIHIAIADRLGTVLVTFDQQMASAARALGLAVVEA